MDEHHRLLRVRLWAALDEVRITRQAQTESHADPRTLLEDDLAALESAVADNRARLHTDQPPGETWPVCFPRAFQNGR